EGPAETDIALGLQAQWLRRLDVKVEIVPHGVPATMALLTLPFDRVQPTRRFESLVGATAADISTARRRSLDAVGAAVAVAETAKRLGRCLDDAEKAIGSDGLVVPLFADMRPTLVALTWKELAFDGLGLWDLRLARFGY